MLGLTVGGKRAMENEYESVLYRPASMPFERRQVEAQAPDALHRSVATHAEAPRLYTDLQTQGSAYRPVSTSVAEATKSRTNPHVLNALHWSEAAGSFTELQTCGSSYTPVSTPLAGATRPHTEPHVLGGLCRPASKHAEVASFTELQRLGTLTNDIRHPDATLKDLERAAMTWFRHAAERLPAQQI
ncbi:uncharacterized protein [Dermacentor albipictus]|uniref:uncharacterized protein isoform X6 n=1 Tax=Dermacentor albipictus TaxID=60249 RepID=UPI0038FCD316